MSTPSFSAENAPTQEHFERKVRPDDVTAGPPPERELTGAEQRTSTRIPYHLEVNLYGEHEFCSGVVTNLSDGGIFIETYYFFDLDVEVKVDLDLPDGRLWLSGRVAWVRDTVGDNCAPGMGIAFRDVSAADQETVLHAIKLASDDCG